MWLHLPQAFQYYPYAITTQMYLDLIYLRTQTPRTEHSSTKVRVYEGLLQQSSYNPLLFACLGVHRAFTNKSDGVH
jgi:hypothetical protein